MPQLGIGDKTLTRFLTVRPRSGQAQLSFRWARNRGLGAAVTCLSDNSGQVSTGGSAPSMQTPGAAAAITPHAMRILLARVWPHVMWRATVHLDLDGLTRHRGFGLCSKRSVSAQGSHGAVSGTVSFSPPELRI